MRLPLTFADFPGRAPAGEPRGPTHSSCSFQVSLNPTLHHSCPRARAGPRHSTVRVMLLPLPWAVAVCGSSWPGTGALAAVPAPRVLSPVGAPAASTAGLGCLGVCQPCASSQQCCGDMQRSQCTGEKQRGHQLGILHGASAGRAPEASRIGPGSFHC